VETQKYTKLFIKLTWIYAICRT